MNRRSRPPRLLAAAVLACVTIAVPLLFSGTPPSAAQDAPVGRKLVAPVGTYLLDALPERCDLVVHTADYPALLTAAERAGLGPRAAWQAAFEAHLTDWGRTAKEPRRLLRGGLALQKLLDGEIVLAGLSLPSRRGPRRAWICGLRTSAGAPALRAALKDIQAGGLEPRYRGGARTEMISGRQVLALRGAYSGIWIALQDGLLLASDHPLALGLMFRGLERVVSEGPPEGGDPLTVLYGELWRARSDGAAEWLEMPGGDGVRPDAAALAAPTDAALSPVVAVSVRLGDRLPLLPDGDPAWLGAVRAALPVTVPAGVSLLPDGTFALGVPAEAPDEVRSALLRAVAADLPGAAWTQRGTVQVLGAGIDFDGAPRPGTAPGSATQLGWARAVGLGAVRPPLPAIHPAAVATAVARVEADAGAAAGGLREWKLIPGVELLSGPAWHGPATFLALRTLGRLSRGLGPGGEAERAAAPPAAAPGAPLPEPVSPGGDDDE